MNYKKHYYALIKKAMIRNRENPNWNEDIYTERHHWLPGSMYPQYKKNKKCLVVLTAREHFVAHWLLWRWHRNSPMAFAFQFMCNTRSGLVSSHVYAEACKVRNIAAKEICSTPEYRAKMSEAVKKACRTPEYRAKMSERSKKLWENREFKTKMAGKSKERWEDPEYHAKVIAKITEQANTPEAKAKRGTTSKLMWQDAEFKEKMSEIRANKWKDPEYHAMMAASLKEQASSQEAKAKRAAASKRNWQNPAYRAKTRGICIHCGYESIKGSITRYHNDNCKHKPKENNNENNSST